MPRVSIIIVALKETEERVNTTFRSIVSQTYKNVETIVIDGGSPEEYLNSIRKYKENISILISESDNGIFDAMNKGIAKASGEWLVFMNIGDSFHDEKVLENVFSKQIEQQTDLIYGDTRYNTTGRITSPLNQISLFYLIHHGICHQSIFFRRYAFTKYGMYSTSHKIGGDPEWLICAFKRGAQFQYVPVTVSDYAGGGASSNWSEQRMLRKRQIGDHLSWHARILFRLYAIWERGKGRLQTKNYKTPLILKSGRRR